MTRATGFTLKDLNDLSESPLLTLLDHICEGSVIVDDHAHILWISDKYREVLGIDPLRAVKGMPVEELIPNSMMRQVVSSGQPILLDLLRVRETWMVVTRIPIRDQEDQVIGGIGFVFYKDMDYLKAFVEKYGRLRGVPSTAEKQLASMRDTKYTFADFIGQSEPVEQLLQRARRAAELDTTVLLLGETGTGKEVLAHAIHHASVRAERPFVGINMAAVPDNLMEAEFFGVAPGAYTGADRKGRKGKIQLANKGTLFLDEVGDLPQSLQSKLLRVLQEQEFEPLGSNEVIRVDVRVIAATSKDLKAMVDVGEFRADLYYRLNVLPIVVPPLRERAVDIELLAGTMIERIAHNLGMAPKWLSESALAYLRDYDWPGNVRELQNTLERTFIFAQGSTLQAEDFLPSTERLPEQREDTVIEPLQSTIARAERDGIRKALETTNNNRSQAARALGISRASLYEKMARYGL
ncbi:sigma-54-dependent Fis family transcriptional regulator [Marinobacter nanhaiticus D15-8W]|uniref:AAA family ATPase n=1 Tax=Marinobacter nanhaiticus D15-8W TaxID=626887 RepID=N6W1C0_9GAMM|nr:sigma 54-interacting transcriptional regulator [Marinobacter nanhaiticus]ENO13909.1 AAA family ATPase [Marinobacter nanhaiticus D15-8W]BES71286.1 sigma-54-dependent Fis family transcriptional regulator [Marinobacter nanhaiticus D15-8W]